MEPDQDAFGRMLQAHIRGEEVYEILERDDGFITAWNAAALYFAPVEGWPPYEREAVGHARGTVLDLGCGTGRHALYLKEKGLSVVGIDRSALAIRICRQRGLENARRLSVEELALLEGEPFDTVLMLGNNFGLVGGRRQAPEILERLQAVTSRRGLLIAESTDPHASHRPCDAAYRKENLRRGRLPGEMRLRVRFECFRGAWFDYLYVSREEMQALLEPSGWRVRRFLEGVGASYVALIEKRPRRRYG